MSFAGILFALFYAVMLTAIFSLVFNNTGTWGGEAFAVHNSTI